MGRTAKWGGLHVHKIPKKVGGKKTGDYYYYVYKTVSKEGGGNTTAYVGVAKLGSDGMPFKEKGGEPQSRKNRFVPLLETEKAVVYHYYDPFAKDGKGSWETLENPTPDVLDDFNKRQWFYDGKSVDEIQQVDVRNDTKTIDAIRKKGGPGTITNLQRVELVGQEDIPLPLFQTDPKKLRKEVKKIEKEFRKEIEIELKEKRDELKEAGSELKKKEEAIEKEGERMQQLIDQFNISVGLVKVNKAGDPLKDDAGNLVLEQGAFTLRPVKTGGKFASMKNRFKTRIESISETADINAAAARSEIIDSIGSREINVFGAASREEIERWVDDRERFVRRAVERDLRRHRPDSDLKATEYKVNEGTPRWYIDKGVTGVSPGQLTPWFELSSDNRKTVSSLFHSMPGVTHAQLWGNDYEDVVIGDGEKVSKFVQENIQNRMRSFITKKKNEAIYTNKGFQVPSDVQVRGFIGEE